MNHQGLGEFELIARYFRDVVARSDVHLGVGDDGAVVQTRADEELVQVMDTMVADVHFPADIPPEALGQRSLAVNLSDLAAMGAEPAWALLSLTLPERDEAWLAAFARGFAASAKAHGVALIGGDTSQGPLTITVQASGFASRTLKRAGARVGDRVWVSGDLGAAAGGLRAWQHAWETADAEALIPRLLRPTPRVALGRELVDVATAAIDVSDGLVADAGHLAAASGVALSLASHQLPLSRGLLRSMGPRAALAAALRGGDDYELLFTAPADSDDAVRSAAEPGLALTTIGEVVTGGGVSLDGESVAGGWDHFAEASC